VFLLNFYGDLPCNCAYAPVFNKISRGFSTLWSVCSFSQPSMLEIAHKSRFCAFSMPLCLKTAHMLQFFTNLAAVFPHYGASAHFCGSSS
jgi:hypothetical protein